MNCNCNLPEKWAAGLQTAQICWPRLQFDSELTATSGLPKLSIDHLQVICNPFLFSKDAYSLCNLEVTQLVILYPVPRRIPTPKRLEDNDESCHSKSCNIPRGYASRSADTV